MSFTKENNAIVSACVDDVATSFCFIDFEKKLPDFSNVMR
jgi:hypothetical protein